MPDVALDIASPCAEIETELTKPVGPGTAVGDGAFGSAAPGRLGFATAYASPCAETARAIVHRHTAVAPSPFCSAPATPPGSASSSDAAKPVTAVRISATDGSTAAADNVETPDPPPPVTATDDVSFGCGVGDGVEPVELALDVELAPSEVPPLESGADVVPLILPAESLVAGSVVVAGAVSVADPVGASDAGLEDAPLSLGVAAAAVPGSVLVVEVSVGGVSAAATPSAAVAETIIAAMIKATARSARARTERPCSTNPPSTVDTAGR